jgi:sortase (surface protein transpeptidase)
MPSEKPFPAAADPIKKLFNLEPAEEKPGTVTPVEESIPADLPMADVINSTAEVVTEEPAPEVLAEPKAAGKPTKEAKEVKEVSTNKDTKEAKSVTTNVEPVLPELTKTAASKIWSVIKIVAPYVAVFAVGLGLYYFYFSDFSISKVVNPNLLKIQTVAQTDKDLEALKSQESARYAAWISQFFFSVTDDNIIAMDSDVSGNGLTNFQKYLLDLNPKLYSTRGGAGDGALVIADINPWTGKRFNDTQITLINRYFNKESISNRITAATLSLQNGEVTPFAQFASEGSPYYVSPARLSEYQAYQQTIGADPNNLPTGTPSNPIITSPNPNPTTNPNPRPITAAPGGAVRNPTPIKKDVPALLEMPSKNLSVPLTFSSSVKNMEVDLRNGLVHYPGTPLPGETGTAYISGHSSGYPWDKSKYKDVFAILGDVPDGTSFSITLTTNDGKKMKYNYVVERRGEYAAADQAQFVNTADSMVALSTCWPVGTTARRLVLFAKLTQTQNL